MAEIYSPGEVVGAGLCIGCGACAGERSDAQMGWNRDGFREPVGPKPWLEQRSEHFSRMCPFSPAARNEDAIAAERLPGAAEAHPLIGRFETCHVGHVAEGEYRAAGSSGGMVSWVASELLRQGLVDGVAHVAPADPQRDEGFFRYRISRDQTELMQGAKSRYYPVDMSEVLREIRDTPGRYAVIGVPCFIKAVQLLRDADPIIAERIPFTLGLFCGHMKSAHFVESFAWQLDVPLEAVRAVEYRRKDADRPANWYTAHLSLTDGSARWQDWWHLADGDWGAGFFQNAPCNYCDDVVAETADIAFGDAWVEPYSSDGRGTNVVIVRSPLMQRLVGDAIADGRLDLTAVDSEFIVGTQAAGFRQRREGLAYRLRFAPPRLPLRKRVAPGEHRLPPGRRLVYRMRWEITRWSHRLFTLAKQSGEPQIYVRWASRARQLYHRLAYPRG